MHLKYHDDYVNMDHITDDIDLQMDLDNAEKKIAYREL